MNRNTITMSMRLSYTDRKDTKSYPYQSNFYKIF